MCREEGDGDMFHAKKSISETSEAAKRRKFGGTERRSFSWIAHRVEQVEPAGTSRYIT